jgi:hypothetical protein
MTKRFPRLVSVGVEMLDWLFQHSLSWRYYRLSYSPGITCRSCGEDVSLVGLWACPCGYTYAGHLMRDCPACGAFPRFIRCYGCGVTEVLPCP